MSGVAPVVLISPAMAIGSAYYRPLVEAFAHHGWEARPMPRRGFERDAPAASREHDWAYDDEIAAIGDEVARARAEDPSRPVLFLGHSLGGQLAVGHDLAREPVDGLVTVGSAIPHHHHYPLGGAAILVMARVLVPVLTSLFGYLPKPAFGAPGAKTLMREWARMVVSGQPPFATRDRLRTPALIVSLEGDTLAPASSVDDFAERLFDSEVVTRWHYLRDEVRPGTTNDHITWVRGSELVVERVVAWWAASTSQRDVSQGLPQ